MKNSVVNSDPCYFRVNTDDDYYNVSFEITYRCNLECRHCFNKSNDEAFIGLSRDDVLTLIDELAEAHVKNVYMTGGEPTKYPYFLDVVSSFNEHGIEVILATNGYDINRYMDFIKENISPKSGVYISIDGCAEVHNTLRGRPDAFERATNSIKMLVAKGIPVRVSSIIWDKNYDSLEEEIEYLKSIGVSQINLTIPVQVGRAETNDIILHKGYPETVEKVRNLQKKYVSDSFKIFLKRQELLNENSLPCQGGQKIMHINANGEIYPCSWVSKAGLSGYSKMWTPGNLYECIKAIRNFGDLIAERETKYGCSGCPAMAQIYNGDKIAKDPLNDLLGV